MGQITTTQKSCCDQISPAPRTMKVGIFTTLSAQCCVSGYTCVLRIYRVMCDLCL